MTRFRWALSLLILFHVTAVALATMPPPSELNAVGPIRRDVDADWLANALTPLFDRLAAIVLRVEGDLYGLATPFRRITRPYILAGVRQDWRMFANPSMENRYVQLRYYLDAGPVSPLISVAELVLPVDPGESFRYFRGKSIRNALAAYLRKDFTETAMDSANGLSSESVYRDLAPLVRYFRDRFERRRAGGRRVARTELWYGGAPIPPRGQRVDQQVLAQRDAILRAYRERPTKAVSRAALARRHSIEREADIIWRLEYIDATGERP